MKNFIIQNQNNKREYSVGNIQIFLIEKSNINFSEVVEKLKLFPKPLLELIDNIYVGYFPDLEKKAVNAAYLEGSIYLLPDHGSVEDATDDIMHELGHAYEESNKDFIYGDQDIAYEFLAKRRHLKSILASQGFDVDNHDFEDVNYSFDMDQLYFVNIGYPLLQALTTNLFLNPYSVTSLREYFASAFEYYFLYKNRKDIKELCPATYRKLEEIEESFYGY